MTLLFCKAGSTFFLVARKLVGKVNKVWFHSGKALLDSSFYLRFIPGRNRTKPREMQIDGQLFSPHLGTA